MEHLQQPHASWQTMLATMIELSNTNTTRSWHSTFPQPKATNMSLKKELRQRALHKKHNTPTIKYTTWQTHQLDCYFSVSNKRNRAVAYDHHPTRQSSLCLDWELTWVDLESQLSKRHLHTHPWLMKRSMTMEIIFCNSMKIEGQV